MIDYLPTALTLIAFALHVAGERRATVLRGGRRDRRARRNALTFYAGLLTILIALQSPIDSLAEKLFWAHMVEHLLLMVVAAPLIVLGHPWMSLWRPLPLSLRRTLAKAAVRSPDMAPFRAVFRVLNTPVGAWLAFNINMIFWHMPGPYDLTLRNLDVHVLEHSLFIVFGLFFWNQALTLPAGGEARPVLNRIAYVGAAMVPNIGLSIYLGFAQHALYAPYAALPHRPGGISALSDQQIGAGIMWSAGDMPYAIAIAVLVDQWWRRVEAITSGLRGQP